MPCANAGRFLRRRMPFPGLREHDRRHDRHSFAPSACVARSAPVASFAPQTPWGSVAWPMKAKPLNGARAGLCDAVQRGSSIGTSGRERLRLGRCGYGGICPRGHRFYWWQQLRRVAASRSTRSTLPWRSGNTSGASAIRLQALWERRLGSRPWQHPRCSPVRREFPISRCSQDVMSAPERRCPPGRRWSCRGRLVWE